MATAPDTVHYILEVLNGAQYDDAPLFTSRAMFGEYALYCKGSVVALVCDNTLFVKLLPESEALAQVCETAPAYPGSKPYYVVEESDLTRIESLPEILVACAKAVANAKKKKGKSGTRSPAKKRKK